MPKAQKQANLTVKTLNISDISPHPKNPRTHSQKQIEKLKDTISTIGFTKGSVVVQASSMNILAGHGIVQALKELGYTQVDVVIADLSDAMAEAFMLADNRLSEDSAWDSEKLEIVLEDLRIENIDLRITGFEDNEIRKPAEEDDYDAEKEQPPAVSQLGDLWEISGHRVLCGDSTKEEDVERVMNGQKADLCLTDPPYNVGLEYSEKTDDSQSRDSFIAWCQKWLALCPKTKIFSVGIKRLLWWDSIVGDPQWVIAWIRRNGQGQTGLLGTSKWDAILLYNIKPDHDIDILEINNDYSENIKSQGKHPTARPIELYGKLLSRFSDSGNYIYDPFLGSGSNLIAADQLDRICYGMEIEPHYIDVIVDRYVKYKKSSDGVFLNRDGERIPYKEVFLDGRA